MRINTIFKNLVGSESMAKEMLNCIKLVTTNSETTYEL